MQPDLIAYGDIGHFNGRAQCRPLGGYRLGWRVPGSKRESMVSEALLVDISTVNGLEPLVTLRPARGAWGLQNLGPCCPLDTVIDMLWRGPAPRK